MRALPVSQWELAANERREFVFIRRNFTAHLILSLTQSVNTRTLSSSETKSLIRNGELVDACSP